MSFGLAANGSSGRWYVEVEERIEDETFVLIIRDHACGEQIDFPRQSRANLGKDIDDLIEALSQTRADLNE
jgi:hypothetical protein